MNSSSGSNVILSVSSTRRRTRLSWLSSTFSTMIMPLLRLVVVLATIVSFWYNVQIQQGQHQQDQNQNLLLQRSFEEPSVLSSPKSISSSSSVENLATAPASTQHVTIVQSDNHTPTEQSPHTKSFVDSYLLDNVTSPPPPLVLQSPIDLSSSDRSSPVPKSSSFVVPNDENTVVTLVSMGPKAGGSFMVELCIRSIRVRGKFYGLVILFTDQFGYDQYSESLSKTDNNTIVVMGHEEDLLPMMNVSTTTAASASAENGSAKYDEVIPRKYKQRSMVFKRFKTLHSKYLDELGRHPDDVRFVLYIDIDNLIGAPLSKFFQDYYDLVQSEYFNSTTSTSTKKTDISFAGFFRDRHLRSKMHSGIIMYDRQHESGCTESWRWEMDHFSHGSDQVMLLRVLNQTWSDPSPGTHETKPPTDEGKFNKCIAFVLPPHHLQFASKRLFRSAAEELPSSNPTNTKKRKKKNRPPAFPTFMHLTSYRLRQIGDDELHDQFLRSVLNIPFPDPEKEEDVATNGGLGGDKMAELSWNNMVSSKATRTK